MYGLATGFRAFYGTRKALHRTLARIHGRYTAHSLLPPPPSARELIEKIIRRAHRIRHLAHRANVRDSRDKFDVHHPTNAQLAIVEELKIPQRIAIYRL